ncbi:hypothetical protein Tco_1263543 [Tanacetum coccineum]
MENLQLPPNVPAYKPIMKFLLNCPLNKSFTNSPSVLYQNYLKEFWSTAVTYDPFPSIDETEQCPLREFLIKFSVLNGQRPLTLDFNIICSSTGLDYKNGKYVAHPTPEVVLGGNYSSTKQVNSIQQLLAYCLIIGTEVDIGEIIYSDLVTKLLNKSRQKYVSYPALQVLLGCDYTQDVKFGFLPGILSKDSSKVESNPETLQLTTLADIQAYLLFEDKLAQESDEEEVFAIGDDMKEYTQADEEEHKSPSPNKDQPEPSHSLTTQELDSGSLIPDLKKFDNIHPLTKRKLIKYLRKVFRVLFSRITQEQWAQQEEAIVSYVVLRGSIEGYYEENIAHKDQTDKLVEASISSLEKSRIATSDLYKGLNIITKLLKDIMNAVKDDLVLNKKVIEATEAYPKNSSALTQLLNLVQNFDF